MNGIFWLASYPKSGNTWVRSFLIKMMNDFDKPLDINELSQIPNAASRFFIDTELAMDSSYLSFEEMNVIRSELYEYLANKANAPMFFKIHDALVHVDPERTRLLVPKKGTAGVIYLVRNPMDLTLSLGNFSAISHDDVILRMKDNKTFLKQGDSYSIQTRQRLFSWSEHVISWIDSDLPLLIIRFEDLLRFPHCFFQEILNFAGIDYTPDQLKQGIEETSFSRLQTQEEQHGFREMPNKSQKFFFKGKTGYWRERLSKDQVRRIVAAHGKVMRRLGYLDPEGNPVF